MCLGACDANSSEAVVARAVFGATVRSARSPKTTDRLRSKTALSSLCDVRVGFGREPAASALFGVLIVPDWRE